MVHIGWIRDVRNQSRGATALFRDLARDPISRFISGFYSRLRKGKPRYSGQWSEPERMAFERFETPNRLASALSSDNNEERMAAEQAMKSITHVKDGYWKWFDNPDYFQSRLSDLLFIGYQSRLTDDFELLKRKLKLPKRLVLPTDEILSHVNPKQFDKTLSDAATENLLQWYHDDFRFLTLCDRLIEANPRLRNGSVV